MQIALYVIYAIMVFAIIGIIYVGTGGRLWFGSREKPDRIKGVTVQFLEADGLGPEPPKLPYAVVSGFEDGRYRLDFIEPFDFEGNSEKFTLVSARHVGHPISRLGRRRLIAVNAFLESGRGFVVLIAPA